MSIDKEIISFILSGSEMSRGGTIATYFETLSEITINANLDAEFIIVVAYSDTSFQEKLKVNSLNHPVQVVVVGDRNTWDQEIFAGLSRANGDYAFVVSDSLEGVDVLLPNMLRLARLNRNDVIGISNRVLLLERIKFLRIEILFRILRHRTKAPLSVSNCNDLLITRKALNWILRDLSSAQCMLEMYLIPGLTFSFVKTEIVRTRYKLSRNMYSRLLTRYTLIPLTILKSCFSLTVLVMLITSLNALLVRWRGVNLFNHVEEQVPGWTTLVLLISFGFAVTIWALYISLRTILHLVDEYSSKPNQVIKSVQRP